MNALKQKWKDFIVYWINDLGLQDKKLDNFEMIFTTYMPTKRRIDCDNTVPKFILDGFSESGFIIDDDGQHLKSLTLRNRKFFTFEELNKAIHEKHLLSWDLDDFILLRRRCQVQLRTLEECLRII